VQGRELAAARVGPGIAEGGHLRLPAWQRC
jgi:hypothetical protein